MKTSSVDKGFDTCGRVLMHSELAGKDTDIPAGIDTANVITSRCVDNDKHRLVLDLDYQARLIPSTHNGRFHLYLDGLELTNEQFGGLLEALATYGVISKVYAKHSIRRGYSSVRLPWVKKDETDQNSDV